MCTAGARESGLLAATDATSSFWRARRARVVGHKAKSERYRNPWQCRQGEFAAPVIQRLKVPLVRVETVQGAYTAFKALVGHDVLQHVPDRLGRPQDGLSTDYDAPRYMNLGTPAKPSHLDSGHQSGASSVQLVAGGDYAT